MSVSLQDLRLRIALARQDLQSSNRADDRSPASVDAAALPRYIDHTLLKLDATESQITVLCREGLKHNFCAVCVRVQFVALSSHLLEGSDVKVACVIDFHNGDSTPAQKAEEAKLALAAGADELDLVIDWRSLKADKLDLVYEGVSAVRGVANDTIVDYARGKPPKQILLKVILETAQLSDDDIVAACVVAKQAGADFVKTSTGFNGPGATVHHVQLMKEVVGESVKVKASGGVRTAADCFKMIQAGADRIGTSNGVAIAQEIEKTPGLSSDGEIQPSNISAHVDGY